MIFLLSKTKLVLFKFTLLYFLSVLLLGCGGGAGGGSSTATNYTPEYNNQPGLEMMGVGTATDAKIFGNGVNIAIVDTGIDFYHAEFSGVSQAGISYDGGSNWYEDGNGHGSHVAGIIAARRNASGMRGVAPKAALKIYKIFDQSGNYSLSSAEHKSMINSIAANADFSNNSWGSTTVQMDDINSTWVTNNFN